MLRARTVSCTGSSVCLLPGFEMPVMVDVNDDAMQPSGKMERVVQAGDDFRNGFPGGFRVLAAGLAESQENRPFSWRSAADAYSAPRRTPSQ